MVIVRGVKLLEVTMHDEAPDFHLLLIGDAGSIVVPEAAAARTHDEHHGGSGCARYDRTVRRLNLSEP